MTEFAIERGQTMDWDDIRPQPAAELAVGAKLDALSIGELEARIVALQGEVARVEQELKARRARAAAAEALFKN
jgi:uncharacterized small protein (DUF1192 family)